MTYATGPGVAAGQTIDPRRYHEAADPNRSPIAPAPPVCLYLEVTNRCNLLCTTCPRTYADLEPPADMDWDRFRSIVDQLPNLKRAVLHGVGEPMLVKHLPTMVRYLAERNVYVLFNTNGTVMTERSGRALIEAGLDELRVSLDAATRETFKAVRGKDYFDRILANVRRFRAMQDRAGAAKPRVSLWLTGLKETVAELPAFVRIAAEIGVREVYLQRLVFFDEDAIGLARPDQALFERMTREESEHLRAAEDLARELGVSFSASGAASEPGLSLERTDEQESVVPLRKALDGDVCDGQRPSAPLLHRALLAARLRELHARRRDAGDAGGDLERTALSGLPRGPADRPSAGDMPQLRPTLEPLRAMRIGEHEAVVSVIAPCLDEAAAIGGLARELLALGVDEVLVVDGGSRDGTPEIAAGAGARVIVEPRRGYGRACAAGVLAAREDATVLAFIDGDGSDDPAAALAIIGPVIAGQADFCLASRLSGEREAGSMTASQVFAGRLAGFLMRARYGVRYTDMAPFRAIRRDRLEALGMVEATYGWNLEMQMRAAASGLRIREVPVRCRRRAGGRSKVSGDWRAIAPVALNLTATFLRIAANVRAPVK